MNQILDYLFTDSRGKTKGGKSNFDNIEDYRYIFPSFLQLYNINLNYAEVTWWEYITLLEGCFLNDCTLRTVIDIRGRDIPNKADAKTRDSLLSLKHKYMLRTENNNDLGTFFKSLKGMVKDGS